MHPLRCPAPYPSSDLSPAPLGVWMLAEPSMEPWLVSPSSSCSVLLPTPTGDSEQNQYGTASIARVLKPRSMHSAYQHSIPPPPAS
jgi:hypothetical protein